MAYKLLALDLDGTLTNERKEITPRTYDALMAAQRAGVKVVLASGRPTYGIAPLAEQLHLADHDGYVLAINGGCVTSWASRQVVYQQNLPPRYVPVLHDAARSHGFHILTYQGEGIAATSVTDQYVLHEAFINKMPVFDYSGDFLTRLEYPIHKCLIVGDPDPLALLERELQDSLRDEVSIYRSAGFFLECVPLGIDKAASLGRLCQQLGILPSEVIACGDGWNDLSMLQFAGLGVAMANAAPELKAIADFVTLSNEEDGVAHVIERYILS